MTPRASHPTPPELAAKKKLLARRTTIARLRRENDSDVLDLAAEPRDNAVVENGELSGVLVLLSERESAELRELDAALDRLERGTWGRCERCQKAIARRRMTAFPEARTCTECVP